MLGQSKEQALTNLRSRIADIEKKPPLAANNFCSTAIETGNLALPPALHEVFTSSPRNSGVAFGFALAAARGMLTSQRPVLILIQLAHDSQQMGVPYAIGLKTLGIDPDRIVLCRPGTMPELLWAIEEAIACKSVAAVIADIPHATRELDFTASRRLSLRNATNGSAVFLVRYGTEREATAAQLRWNIEPVVSGETPFDARAPAEPRWQITLEKGRLGSRSDPVGWLVDWTKDGLVLAKPQNGAATRSHRAATLSGIAPAGLGDRLSEAS